MLDMTSYLIGKKSGGGGPVPTGKIDITTTAETDVSAYATAQVVDSDLVAENIKKDVNILGVVGTLESGAELVSIDGVKVDREMRLVSVLFNRALPQLPISFLNGNAVTLSDGMHIIGGEYSTRRHYKFDGELTELSELTFNSNKNSAVVLNDEIHILGDNSSKTQHYKYNGNSWASVSTLPYNFYNGAAVVLNGEIHILGGDEGQTMHYKWDGNSWTSVSTLPYKFYGGGRAVVYNNEIHILSTYLSSAQKSHYKWNGSSWVSVSTLPYALYQGAVAVLNNKIHIMGGGYGTTKHYTFDGSTWTAVSDIPYNFYNGSCSVLNDKIHIMGGQTSPQTMHYILDVDAYIE